jgi:hypothetical protein
MPVVLEAEMVVMTWVTSGKCEFVVITSHHFSCTFLTLQLSILL